METSLHREMKLLYAGAAARTEVRYGRYRVDAVVGDELVEIQHGRLGAISFKIAELLKEHTVRVVKPIVREKFLVKRHRRGGKIVSRRRSPKRGQIFDLFHEMVYFTKVFPHPRLSIEAVLVDVEEYRFPGHGRRRRWGKNDHQVEDQLLVCVAESRVLRTAADLVSLLACDLPKRFHTGQLAEAIGKPRWMAQRVAYCLRETGAAKIAGKQGNSLMYQLVGRGPGKRPRAA
ncbi:MAG TPA: hypothetical protein VGG64_18920 [Pirellulales bacterium]|jgi:hypothetical protein